MIPSGKNVFRLKAFQPRKCKRPAAASAFGMSA